MKDSFFTLTFFPRKPRSEGNGEYPIYARITTEGQKTEFTIGRKVHPSNCKKSNFDDFSDKRIMEIQKKLNRRPREKIDFDTPKKRFFDKVA